MYKKRHQYTMQEFFLPFEGELDPSNRWVRYAAIIPWGEIERKYASRFKGQVGNIAKPARVAVGALLIQTRFNLTDRETVQQIRENPYLQYFLGFKAFKAKVPFDASLMVHFRKRLGANIVNDISKLISMEDTRNDSNQDSQDGDPPAGGKSDNTPCEPDENVTGTDSGEDSPKANQGTLMLDATCAPADIRYPTDISLLNESREKLESIIDTLHEPVKGKVNKPRTYRHKARREYLQAAKQRRLGRKKLRKALRKQLGYVARNLGIITMQLEQQPIELISCRQQEQLQTIKEIYRQQKYMYDHKTNSVANRIVSVSQPHIRPIVRGKAGASVEFGAKVAVSLVNGYSFIEKLSWDNFNEGGTLIASVEAYKKTHGFYPKAVLADTIYRTRENRHYCKKWGIRLSGPQLGRPGAGTRRADKRQAQQDARDRNWVEGKFGEGKRAYGLGLIRTKLESTSETAISLQFLMMNLERRLRVLFTLFCKRLVYGCIGPVQARVI